MLGKLHLERRSGIAKGLALITLALVGAGVVAAVGYLSMTGTGNSTESVVSSSYLASTSQSTSVPTSTRPSASSASTTASSSSTTSGVVASSLSTTSTNVGSTKTSSTSSNTTMCSPFENNLIRVVFANTTLPKVADLLGNFSEMSVSSKLGVNVSAIESYAIVARPVVDSLRYYEVNVSTSSWSRLSNFSVDIASTVWFAPNGTATLVKSKLGNFTGSTAQLFGEGLVSTFLQVLHSSAQARSITSSSDYRILNESTISLGPTKVNITNYELKSLPLTNCGVTLSKFIDSVGNVPGTRFPLLLYTDVEGTYQSRPIVLMMKVMSIAVAHP